MKAFFFYETDRLKFDLQRLTEWFYKPYAKMIFDHPHVVEQQPFGYVDCFTMDMSKEFHTVLASKSKKSVLLTMSRRFSMWISQLFNTTTMGLSIPVSVRNTRLEQIPICEISFCLLMIPSHSIVHVKQSKVEASIRELHRF